MAKFPEPVAEAAAFAPRPDLADMVEISALQDCVADSEIQLVIVGQDQNLGARRHRGGKLGRGILNFQG